MRTLIVLCALAAAAVARPSDTYNPAYDSFNAQELVDNVRLLKNYGRCFLEEGPCTSEGKDFKNIIPEALRTQCGKCTRKQRELVRTVVHGFQDKLPDLWEKLVAKEDPKGDHKKSFDEFLHASE